MRLISALADYGDKSADRESLFLGKFAKVLTHLSNPTGGNHLFQLDLNEALGKDAAYMAKPSLSGLLTATQHWEIDYRNVSEFIGGLSDKFR